MEEGGEGRGGTCRRPMPKLSHPHTLPIPRNDAPPASLQANLVTRWQSQWWTCGLMDLILRHLEPFSME